MGTTASNTGWLSAAACAARTGLTVRALRIYERAALLTPTRSANGWRRYGPADLTRLNTIMILKGLGLTLAQIRAVISDRPPLLLQVLDLQANAWKEKITGAQRALASVEAARHRLQSRQDLSIEDLCSLIKTLDESGGLPMQNAASIMRDLINELITPDEERAWITWWTKHPADAKATKEFAEEQNALFARTRDLADQGVDPTSPEALDLVREHDAILLRHQVRERTVRLLDWNSPVTYKFYSLGTTARSRQQEPSILTQSAMDFLGAARKASPCARLIKSILEQISVLIEARAEPAAAEADDVVHRFRQACAQYHLGNPYAVARCAPFLERVSRHETVAHNEQAWDFLARAYQPGSDAGDGEVS